MKRRKAAVVALAALTALGVAAMSSRGSRSAGVEPSSTEATGTGDLAPDTLWPAGTRQLLSVDWRTRAAGHLDRNDQELATDVRVRGELELRSFGVREGATWLGVRWSRIDAGTITALGAVQLDVAALAERLRALDAVAVIAPDGRLHELRFSPTSDVVAVRLTRSLLLELTAQLASANGAGPVVDTAVGRARVARTEDAGAFAVTRSGYDELEAFPSGFEPAEPSVAAHGEVVVGSGRVLARLTSDEELSLDDVDGVLRGFRSSTTLRIASVSSSKSATGEVPSYASSPLRGIGDAGGGRRASLERRAAGVSPATLFSDVRLAGVLPPPGPTEWVWHDAAFLELHPEEAAPLLERAGKELDARGRAAAFDVVVVSGSVEGQRALVVALSTWAAREPAELVVLAQRLGYLRSPTEETSAFVAREEARLRGSDAGYAYAYTLGAIAGTRAQKDPAAARALVAPLVAQLTAATKPDAREALLRALGNAGLEPTAPAVLGYRADPEPLVRRAVASALRKMEGGDVLDALLVLATDEDGDVARDALTSLFRKELDEDDWATLEKAVREDRVPIDALSPLVSGLAMRLADSPHPTSMLVFLLASARTPPKLHLRIESILGDAGAP